MAEKDASKLTTVTGGAIKWADSTAPLPTGPNYTFDPTVWHDLGAIKAEPKLSEDITSTTVELWNMDDVTLGSKTAHTLSFSTGQFDYDTIKVRFNADFDEDGGFTPGSSQWTGMLACLLFYANHVDLLLAPNATRTGGDDVDFLKNDLTEFSSEFALNPDSRINGKPWKLFPGVRIDVPTTDSGE